MVFGGRAAKAGLFGRAATCWPSEWLSRDGRLPPDRRTSDRRRRITLGRGSTSHRLENRVTLRRPDPVEQGVCRCPSSHSWCSSCGRSLARVGSGSGTAGRAGPSARQRARKDAVRYPLWRTDRPRQRPGGGRRSRGRSPQAGLEDERGGCRLGADLVAFERMDGAQLASIEIAQHKARVSVTFRRETKVLESGVSRAA